MQRRLFLNLLLLPLAFPPFLFAPRALPVFFFVLYSKSAGLLFCLHRDRWYRLKLFKIISHVPHSPSWSISFLGCLSLSFVFLPACPCCPTQPSESGYRPTQNSNDRSEHQYVRCNDSTFSYLLNYLVKASWCNDRNLCYRAHSD